ncbi:MAG: FecR domain-containing protein [Kiritimatiellae bacterium]|nr:FecR domain-containing protein [Kiritimatiellia bacterium]
MDRFEQLLADYTEGALDLREAGELVELIRSDPALQRRFLDLVRIESVLRSEHTPAHMQADLERRVAMCLVEPAHLESTAEQVLDRIARIPSGRAPAARRRRRPPRLRRPASVWPWWGTALAASILILLGLTFNGQIGRLVDRFEPAAAACVARLERVEGAGTVWSGSTGEPASAGRALVGSDRIVMGAGGRAVVRLSDGTSLALGTGADLTLEGQVTPAARRVVFVAAGTVAAEVVPQPAGREFTVRTPHARVQALGTAFAVSVLPGSSRIDVQRGEVLVTNLANRETARLAAGTYAVVGERTVVAARSAFERGARDGPGAGPEVLYTFEERQGPTIRDVSGVGRPLDLRIPEPGAVRWLPGGGLSVREPTLLASAVPAEKVTDACRASGEVTVEVWIRPANSVQGATRQDGPARIVTLSDGYQTRNITLGQWADRFHVRVRRTGTGLGGEPAPVTRPAARTRPMHVVFTRARSGAMKFFVDGTDVYEGTEADSQVHDDPPVSPGDLLDWSREFRLGLANEFGGQRAWLGEYYLVAIYSRALTADEVGRNYRLGWQHRLVRDRAGGRQASRL